MGFEGGNIGEFELKTTAKENQLRSGGLSRSYAVAYAQANLNYYQEYGKRFSTTLGGGFRYLLNNEVEIAPTVNGIVFNANQQTGKIASVKLAPFFYQGTFMVNYHTDNAGNFSVGYVAVGGLLGITHNASMRWHYHPCHHIPLVYRPSHLAHIATQSPCQTALSPQSQAERSKP